MDSADVLALIDALPGRRVAVIGDAIADEFVYGRVARVSREAPVLILEYDSTQVVPGGAGNARRPNCPATNVTSGASTCNECNRSVQRTLPVTVPCTHLLMPAMRGG